MARYRVSVNEDYCKGCGICVHFCPRGAIKLSQEFNANGFNVPVEMTMDKCRACRLCELYCPDFAIAVEESD